MHPSRIALVASGGIAAASLLFDFLVADLGGDVVGWDATAWPAVVLIGAASLLAVVGDRREGLPPSGTLVVVLLTAAATVFAVAKLVDAAEASRIVREAAGRAGIGPGAWILLVAALVALAGAVGTSSRRVG